MIKVIIILGDQWKTAKMKNGQEMPGGPFWHGIRKPFSSDGDNEKHALNWQQGADDDNND